MENQNYLEERRERLNRLTEWIREKKWSDRYFTEVYKKFNEEIRIEQDKGGGIYLDYLLQTEHKADLYRHSKTKSKRQKHDLYEDFCSNFISDVIEGEARY